MVYQIQIKKIGKVIKGYESTDRKSAEEKKNQLQGFYPNFKLEIVKKREKAKKLKNMY